MKRVVDQVWPFVGHGLFWGWNLLFFTVLWVGLGPAVLWEMTVAALSGMVPWPYVVLGAAILVTPAVGMVVGFVWLRRDPGRLLSLFYGVQAPVLLLLLVRMFAIQQLTWSTALALGLVAVGAAALLRTLVHGVEEASDGLQLVRLSAHAAYLVAGIWCAVVVGIYASGLWVLFLTEVVWNFRPLELLAELWRHPQMVWVLPMMLFWLMTMLVFALFPLAAVGISVRSWQLVHRASQARLGPAVAGVTSVATIGLVIGAFALATRQPQHAAFDALQHIASDADRKAALQDSERIRQGLIAAFLSSERWLDSDPDGEHVRQLWREAGSELLGSTAQRVWCVAMAPFLYQPVNPDRAPGGLRGWAPSDAGWAEAHYGAFFDRPMRRAERSTLLAAARQTWNWQDAQAGLLDVGEQKVHLESQHVEVQPQGDFARVTIHDVYRNRTWQQQEIFLSFSLPETAAVTGLWLGTTADRVEAFHHVVAPRGAAQQVYKEQVRRRVDPALLEQVGPQQYRLRAFPIEPRTGRADDVWSIASEGPPMHLWLEVVVPRMGEGGEAHWPLPSLREARNLFWDADTERWVDQTSVALDAQDPWTPRRVAAPDAARRVQRAVVAGFEVVAVPAQQAAGPLPGRIRVLVDGTRSMDAHRAAVSQTLRALAERTQLEVICTRDAVVQRCDGYDAASALFFGARALSDQVADAARLGGSGPLVVVTDEGSYELASLAGEPEALVGWPSDAPLWLLHLGGVLPQAYADATLDAMARSGGGVADSVQALIARMSDPDLHDGYRFTFNPVDERTEKAGGGGLFAHIAARQAIAALDRAAPEGSLDHLDAVHALAVRHDVVTAYSSMIVLVNQAQRDALKRAEESEDRFDREVETGSEDLPDVTSAPEPQTWLLMGIGGGLLMLGRRRRRGTEERRGR
ncbi:MAG: TIGR02921 family PEP-CTERM protein [Myxococcales bacterium]|nr:TIGR02921 family PEP-CTERM protein [Myxococcales bacterium]